MTPASAVAAAVTFVWLGMVLAISFLETPLKFRAPDVTLRIGLGIGRIVFRALNIAEGVLAAALVAAIVAAVSPSDGVVAAASIAVLLLVIQVAIVRPRLSRRSDRILAGESAPRSRSHYVYVVLEVLKVAALAVGGALLFST